MGSIGRILNIKGKKPLLPIVEIESGRILTVIEGGGIYRGYEFIIVLTPFRHRCGYISIPCGHFFDRYEPKNLDSFCIKCHGGITYSGRFNDIKKFLEIEDTDRWIGFDCAHGGDFPDRESYLKCYNIPSNHVLHVLNDYEKVYPLPKGRSIKTYNFVEIECRKIIDQLIHIDEKNKYINRKKLEIQQSELKIDKTDDSYRLSLVDIYTGEVKRQIEFGIIRGDCALIDLERFCILANILLHGGR